MLGQGNYPRIEQITGTVTGISRQADDSSRIGKVTIRGADLKLQDLAADLVIGQL